MGFQIQGNTGTIAEVTDPLVSNRSPRALVVALPDESINSGFNAIVSEQDAGDVTGARRIKELEGSEDYRLRVGIDTPFLNEQFPGAALNTALWTQAATTATITVASGYLTLNAGLSTASGAVARVQTYRMFPLYGTCEMYAEMIVQFAQLPVTSNVTEWGFGIATGVAAPTDGAFFRLGGTGNFECVVSNNGVETTAGPFDFKALVGANVSHHFLVSISDDDVNFWIDNVLIASVARPENAASMTASNEQPLLLRTYNTSATTAAQVMRVGKASVWLGDAQAPKPWPHTAAGAGGMGYQGQTGGTMGSTANYANSADPAASAALSNTAALVSGLGGQARFNAAATAITDGIVTSFQVPVGTAALPGKTLYITGIKISAFNQGAAVATTATTLGWSLAFGQTAVSLATAEAAGTKAPRRIALGFMTWPVGAAIGDMPTRGDLYMPFSSPVVVQPGEFVASVAKFVVGTATASQVIWVNVTFDAYYE